MIHLPINEVVSNLLKAMVSIRNRQTKGCLVDNENVDILSTTLTGAQQRQQDESVGN